jgi:predicted metal-binding protein
VSGELSTNDGEKFPMMCNLEIEDDAIFISSVVFYKQRENEYCALEEVVKKIQLPLSINIGLKINGKNQSLNFTANKVDIYKNNIRTNL